MKVLVLGVRGIPNVQGGVETHAEHLYEHLAAGGCKIEIVVRTPFTSAARKTVGAIRLRRLWAPRAAGFEALVHSLIGVLYAGLARPDILHIHAVGPAIVTPLARLFGLRVVVTHHGPDYERDKWGSFARWVLRVGERVGMRYAHARIAVSQVIADLIQKNYGMDAQRIPNGVTPRSASTHSDYLSKVGLEPGRYFLQVSRMVPEKRQVDLLQAFASSRPAGWKLALVGDLDASAYAQQIKSAAAECGDVVLTGFLNGEPLRQVYSHAGAFVLPSSHEGLPIVVLEALSYGLPVITSSIPANLEIGLAESDYFKVGDVVSLAQLLSQLALRATTAEERAARIKFVVERYDWGRVAAHTLDVYRKVNGGRRS